jgi:hypothetical protein
MVQKSERKIHFELELSAVASSDDGEGTKKESRVTTLMKLDPSDVAHAAMLGKKVAAAFNKLRQQAEGKYR